MGKHSRNLKTEVTRSPMDSSVNTIRGGKSILIPEEPSAKDSDDQVVLP